MAKGAPFVVLSYTLFDFSGVAIMAVGISAILGHAFSPVLRLRGGKSVAVTFGVLLSLPQNEMLIVFALFMLLGFLFIEVDAWRVMVGPSGALAYLAITGSDSPELLFMSSVLVVLGLKHFNDLKTMPGLKGNLFNWLQSKERGTRSG
jgi:glycerol-3-phosphate acyltransferase PlsY